jgi:hypothetical protein
MQSQNQRPFTAKDAADAKESKENQQQNQQRFTTEDTHSTPFGRSGQAQDTEKGKTTAQERAEALVRRIGEACDELERLAEENPELVGRVTRGAEEHKDAYIRLKARLELADEAPRCRWVRQDGTSCGSPQMKKHIYCFAHWQMMEARALALSLPALEDANAIQIGIMRIQKALIEGTISAKMAGLLLYSMQLALQNVGRVTFGQVKTQELVRETVDEAQAFSEKAVSNQRSAFSQNQQQRQNHFTAKDAEDANENKTLPLMNADDTDKEEHLQRMDANERGLEPRTLPVEWRPSADMYRMDTREGMEAYEASFRMKIAPWLDRAGTPPRAPLPQRANTGLVGDPGAVPHEHGLPHGDDGTHDPSQMHANLG